MNFKLQHVLRWSCSGTPVKIHTSYWYSWALWGVVQQSLRPWALSFPLQQLLQLLPQLFWVLNPRKGCTGRYWTGRALWQDLSRPQTLLNHVFPKKDSSPAPVLFPAVLWEQWEPSWVGEARFAVSILLPATLISSTIRLLISHRYNIILQPSRQAEFAAMAIVPAGSLHTNSTFC